MKKTLFIYALSLYGFGAICSAATIQLMPLVTSLSGKNTTNQTITSVSIAGADVIGFLGTGTESQWYWTTGNNDRNWGGVSSDVPNQSLTLKGMSGTVGSVTGVKLAPVDAAAYENMTFSFDLDCANTGTNFTYSLWFDTQDGSALQLTQGNRTGITGLSSISYDFSAEQLATMSAQGAGSLYVVFSNKAADAFTATVSNLSLSAVEKSIPEPSTATLGLVALAGLLSRRRRV